MKAFVAIEDAEELMAQALQMSELERDCFFAMGDDAWTVQELVEETGRSRSMVQRALKTLHDKGVVMREGKTDRTIYYVYERAPLHEVRDAVLQILDEWHGEMQQLLEN